MPLPRTARALSLGAALSLLGLAAPAPAQAATGPGTRPKTTPTAPADMVDLSTVAPGILLDMRYNTAHNFVGRPIAGYLEGRCLLTRAAANALAQVQRDVRARGYSLKMYDCYRPQRAVDDFARWAAGKDDRMKREFYPRVDRTKLFQLGYIAARSGHTHGSTMDLTLVKLPARPQPAWSPRLANRPCIGSTPATRFPDNMVDMGTSFDCFDTRAHTDNPYSTATQKANRNLLRSAMARRGFTNLPEEWWHFTLKNEPHPNTFYDFPVARSSLRR